MSVLGYSLGHIVNIVGIIYNNLMEKIQSGALFDERVQEEKDKDFLLAEAVSALEPVKWVEKSESELRSFPINNQDGSGSCVAHSAATLLGVMYKLNNPSDDFVKFSPADIYQRRNNKPNAGMHGVDAFKIMQEGVTLEALVPSQNMSDAEMDGIHISDYKKEVGKIFKIGGFIQPPIKDIDAVASVIQKTGKAVMDWFFFTLDEWRLDVPVIKDHTLKAHDERAERHSVAAVDFLIYKGEKALKINDSWGFGAGMGGCRFITESFFKERNFFSAYPMNFKFGAQSRIKKDILHFGFDLEFSPIVTYNKTVKLLQKTLQGYGYYPQMECTGYYGAINRRAVGKFQERYDIAMKGDAGYGRLGPRTREKLNSLLND